MVDLKPSPLPAPAATGTLAQKPLAHLLVYALDRQLTGTLELRAPSGEHAFLVLDEGCVAKVETSDGGTNLGRILFELGHLDEPTLASSLTELASTRRLHGVLLRERGAITEGQLQEGLRQLRIVKLVQAFRLPPESTFAFYNKLDVVPTRPGDVPPAPPLAAVWRGVRENPPMPHVESVLVRASGHAVRVPATAPLDPFGFEGAERDAAECLRLKALPLAELVAAGFLPPRTTELLVYVLLITKHADIVPASGGVTSQPSSVPPRTAAFGSGQYATQVSFSLRAAAPAETPPSSVPPSTPAAPFSRTPSGFPAIRTPTPGLPPRMPALPNMASSMPPSGASSVPPSDPSSSRPPPYARRNAAGSAFFVQAEMNLALRDYAEAEALCRKALLACPGFPDYVALLAFCEANDPRKTSDEHTRAQIMVIDRALASDPRCRRARYYRGELHKRIGAIDDALDDFTAAVEADPDDVDAERALRLLRLRAGRSISPAPGTRHSTDPPKHSSGMFERRKKR